MNTGGVSISLAELLTRHLDLSGKTQSYVVKTIQNKFGGLKKVKVKPETISKLKTGTIGETAWQNLIAIAWALELDRDQADELLLSGKKQNLKGCYRLASPEESVLFDAWPQIGESDPPSDTTDHDNLVVDQFSTTPWRWLSEVPRRIAVIAIAVLLLVGVVIYNFVSQDQPADLSGLSQSDLELTPVFYRVSGSAIRALGYSPDGSVVALGDADGLVQLWSTDQGEAVATDFAQHAGAIRSVSFSPDGSKLATASEDSNVGIWDIETGELIAKITAAHDSAVRGVAFNPAGTEFASVGEDGFLKRWDTTTGQLIDSPIEADFPGQTIHVAYHPNGNEIATVGEQFIVKLWDAKTGETTRAPLPQAPQWIRQVTYRPDGNQLATAGRDSFVRLYDDEMRLLSGHTDKLNAVAYSPDGSILASVGDDQVLWIWDTHSAQDIVGPQSGHRDAILEVAFRPDGRQLATTSANGELGLWRIRRTG